MAGPCQTKGSQGAGGVEMEEGGTNKGRPKWPAPARIRGGERKNGAKRRQRRTKWPAPQGAGVGNGRR